MDVCLTSPKTEEGENIVAPVTASCCVGALLYFRFLRKVFWGAKENEARTYENLRRKLHLWKQYRYISEEASIFFQTLLMKKYNAFGYNRYSAFVLRYCYFLLLFSASLSPSRSWSPSALPRRRRLPRRAEEGSKRQRSLRTWFGIKKVNKNEIWKSKINNFKVARGNVLVSIVTYLGNDFILKDGCPQVIQKRKTWKKSILYQIAFCSNTKCFSTEKYLLFNSFRSLSAILQTESA